MGKNGGIPCGFEKTAFGYLIASEEGGIGGLWNGKPCHILGMTDPDHNTETVFFITVGDDSSDKVKEVKETEVVIIG